MKSKTPAPVGHPRPQMVRPAWESLNGFWAFSMRAPSSARFPNEIEWESKILVPFAPETPASRIGDTGFHAVCWYQREFAVPTLPPNQRLLLHFGAVDYQAKVWVNDVFVGSHSGGYTPFFFDITDAVRVGKVQRVTVRVFDDPLDLTQPRGKQDWQLEPHSIWYPRTTGIWQTVWLEQVPATRIGRLLWRSSLARWELSLDSWLGGDPRTDLQMRVRLSCRDQLLADDRYAVVHGEVHRRIGLSDPGIDDFRNELLWSPSSPTLIDAVVELIDGDGKLVDHVESYTALRSINIEGKHFVLNGRPYPLRLVLDQGYWPETGLTAPSDQALERDVRLAKEMGFNGVRKHQKIEDPRFLSWADRLGLLVWEEMPSAYRFTSDAIERLTREWLDVLRRDASHPCIVAWVPLNESWGVPNLPSAVSERHYVQMLYHMTKTLDPTRPVIGNDGWESVATDMVGIHDYEGDPQRLAHRYNADVLLPHLLNQERPAGRALVVGDQIQRDQPVVLTEFGGVAIAKEGAWGYRQCKTEADFEAHYIELMGVVHSLGLLAGFCYTQFTDTYQEANGLLTAERKPKFSLETMRAATRGPSAREG